MLGVNRKWRDCSTIVHLCLLGDWEVDYSKAVTILLDNNVKVLVYSGDRDFIVNWRGGESWSNNLRWKFQ